MRVPAGRAAVAAVVITIAAACSGSDSTGTTPATPCAAANVVTLDTLQAITLPAASANCLEMDAGTGTYVIVPHFAATASDTNTVRYEIGPLGAASADVASAHAMSPALVAGIRTAPAKRRWATAAAFDHTRHELARTLASRLREDPGTRIATTAALAVAQSNPPPPLGSTRVFSVCGNLNCSSFKLDTAVLKFVGTNVMLYQSQDAPAEPNGFTDEQLAALASVFDQTLYPIDASTFAAPTDIDANGHEIVLISPKVNSLVTNSQCQQSGYVAGFFFAGDLILGYSGGNNGEIYYSISPDPSGTFSCAHTVSDVGDVGGGTFLHETLHMTNFGQKVLINGLPDTEEEFLDEGMARIAEELGSLHYEALFPWPTGRTSSSQLFPDSAEGYISGDLYNSYQYLLSPGPNTGTITIPNGSNLEDSGAEWLFLRWLGDQYGSAIFGSIVRSALTGQANLEAQAGQPMAALFGEQRLALYSDSLLGVPRTAVAAPYRYSSRNLRQLFQAVFNAEGGPTSQFPFAFPIEPAPLTAGAKVTGSMLKGSTNFYRFTAPATGSAALLHFAMPGGGSFPTALGAQVTVLRCGTGTSECQ